MLRKLSFLVIIVAAIFLMAGCHLKEKISENITEKVVEKALGEDANVDVDDGDVSFKNEDGDEVTIDDEDGFTFEGGDGSVVVSGGDYEWPEGQAADYLPAFNEGKISYILNSEEACMVSVEDTDSEDYDNYVKAVADKGYTVDKVESSAEDMQIYSASSSDGVTATVSYINSERILNITLDASGKQ